MTIGAKRTSVRKMVCHPVFVQACCVAYSSAYLAFTHASLIVTGQHEYKDGYCKEKKQECDYWCQKDKCEKDGMSPNFAFLLPPVLALQICLPVR